MRATAVAVVDRTCTNLRSSVKRDSSTPREKTAKTSMRSAPYVASCGTESRASSARYWIHIPSYPPQTNPTKRSRPTLYRNRFPLQKSLFIRLHNCQVLMCPISPTLRKKEALVPERLIHNKAQVHLPVMTCLGVSPHVVRTSATTVNQLGFQVGVCSRRGRLLKPHD